nr:general odorant binding protein 2 [Quadrastichus mendeli]
MKTSFVFLLTLAAVITESLQADDAVLQKKIQECFAESKIPDDLQKTAITAQLDNPKLKCFNACMMKKKGTMKNGKINPETQLAEAQPESYDIIKEVVRTCSDIANRQSDECEVSYSYVKCLINNAGAYQGLQ